jgi:Fe-S cluster assembly ATP-binding protein
MSDSLYTIREVVNRDYQFGFVTDVEQDTLPPGLDEELLERPLNQGFSGGEKKRNEILQMAVLEPRLAILDETDSGLDIDALRVVAASVNALRGRQRSFLVITHYQRLLEHLVPDVVHVVKDGRIVRTGSGELALELESHGYERLPAAAAG